MYFPNVVSLKQFYSSALGGMAQRAIVREIGHMWPEAHKEEILAGGYPLPFLNGLNTEDNRIAVAMPAQQGAIYWPSQQPGRVILTHEAELPFPDSHFNRVFLAHALEHTEQLRGLMQEIWRVLTPGGRMLAVIPNRLSFWARSHHSPFGYGRPFSLHQMRELLSESQLTYTRSASALFALPIPMRWVIRSAPLVEKLGGALLPMFGGVLLVEAEKQIYAALKQPVLARRPHPAAIPAVQPQTARTTGIF